MTTKNKVKDIFIISNGIYWVSYLIRSFLIFEFKNPWQWIFELKENETLRHFTLIIFFVYTILFLIYTNIADEWNLKSNHVRRVLIIFILGGICGLLSFNVKIS